ncbi:methyltransferase domain-containing protein [Clostridium bovifaecis]|uniref:Methyltransferase domain-containing protein n=1 Tax=Clostridium bovifaecis TaxID=2184719 RepID=A0A6I6EZX3_9CLOT|nr:methyltransferase domain-containing protein [Clostridium bovifaecis]
MDYIGNRQYWDEKFSNRSDMPLEPEKSLVENIKYFKKGTVLDVACGDGRNALFLAENNFRVTGVDFSRKALKRLEIFANRKNYNIVTKEADLAKSDSLHDLGSFDNILINHYKLNEGQLLNLKKHIDDDGIVFICGFGHKYRLDSKVKEKDLIKPVDFENFSKVFQLIKYIESEDARGFFVTYIFRKSY